MPTARRRPVVAAWLAAGLLASGGRADVDDVVLNEVMLRNTDTLASPGGSFVPWLELYNRGSRPIDLADVRIGFDGDAARTWRLAAAAELAAGAYLAIRADEMLGPDGETA